LKPEKFDRQTLNLRRVRRGNMGPPICDGEKRRKKKNLTKQDRRNAVVEAVRREIEARST